MSGEEVPLHGRHDGAEGFSRFLMPIHRDGHKFIGAGLALTCVLFWLWPDLAWIALLLTGWLVHFFRDPHRVTPLRSGLVIAPADGRIVAVSQVRPPQELGLGDALRARISICLSMLDVHVNRSPIAGQVVRSIYVPGVFMSAARDKASEDNERHALVIANTMAPLGSSSS